MSSSLVFVVIVGLWVVFLVPHWLRRREQLSGSRHRDRFSGDLRVLSRRAQRRRDETVPAGGRVLAAPARRSNDGRVRRDPVEAAPAGARDSQPRGRGRGPRRTGRTVLAAGVLALPVLLLAAAGLAVAGLAPVWAPAVPLATLGLAVAALRARARRRRAVRRRRPGAAAVAGPAGSAPAAGAVAAGEVAAGAVAAGAVVAVGRGVAAPAAWEVAAGAVGRVTAVQAHPAPAASPVPAARLGSAVPSGPGGGGAARPSTPPGREVDPRAWTPVPVPPPTYTLKPEAPRRQDPAAAPVPAVAAAPLRAPARPRPPAGLLGDLDAVLQRRRAAGE